MSLEKLPIEYISGARILRLELEEALTAFQQAREYRPVFPYVNRLDFALAWGHPPTALYLNHSLPEIIFTLWMEAPNIFSSSHYYSEPLHGLFEADRLLEKKPSLREHFIETTARNLETAKLTVAPENLTHFAEWIYACNIRCPGIRLGYEVHHQILKNTKDKIQKGDMADFSHIKCIAYSDIITVDRRMYSYVNQACKGVGLPYENRIYRDLSKALDTIAA